MLRRLHRAAPSALGLALATILLALVSRLLTVFGRYAVDSDSVAQQSLLWTWREQGHNVTYLPSNTWLLKWPLYAAVESLSLSPEVRLWLEAGIANAVGYGLVASACWSLADRPGFERRWTDVALPSVWVVTLGGALGYYMAIMPNFRNIEIGLAYWSVAFCSKYLGSATTSPETPRRDWRKGLGLPALASLVLSVFWLDDPYFGLVLGLPLAGICATWWCFHRRAHKLLTVSGVIAASFALTLLWHRLLKLLGVVIVPQASVLSINPAQVQDRLGLLWPAVASQIGLRPQHLTPAPTLGVAVLLAGALSSVMLAHWAYRRGALALLLLAMSWVIIALATAVKGGVADVSAGRYLMPAIVALATLLGLGAARLRAHRRSLSRIATGVLVAAIAANVVQFTSVPPARHAAYQEHARLVDAITATGVTKGYADYWASNIHVHATRGRLAITPVSCADGRLRLWEFLTDSSRDRLAAPRTFLVWDDRAFDGCTLEQVVTQFGDPVDRIPVAAPSGGPTGLLLVFDRDISSRMAE